MMEKKEANRLTVVFVVLVCCGTLQFVSSCLAPVPPLEGLTCTAVDECGQGATCHRGFCRTQCTTDSTCSSGDVCSTGVCVKRPRNEVDETNDINDAKERNTTEPDAASEPPSVRENERIKEKKEAVPEHATDVNAGPEKACTPGTQQDCYTGPRGTSGQGPCRKGSQYCNADRTWGVCSGETTPSIESCNGTDDDCDGKVDNVGKTPLCPSGQHCTKGVCACDSLSCRGCCKAGVCVTPPAHTAKQCGAQGVACFSCDEAVADNCVGGACQCGTASACTGTAKCHKGRCLCDDVSFADVRVNGSLATTKPIMVEPGKQVTLQVKYQLSQRLHPSCPGCQEQLVIGIFSLGYGATAFGCAFDGKPGDCRTPTTGSTSFTFESPRSPGIYELRWLRTSKASCALGQTEFNENANTQSPVIARIEVLQPQCRPSVSSVFNVSLNGQGKEIAVKPGAPVILTTSYRLSQRANCGSCFAQIVVGFIRNGSSLSGCLYHGQPQACPGTEKSSQNYVFQAPSTKGVYSIRWGLFSENLCQNAIHKFNQAPAPSTYTIGRLHVQ